VRRVTINLATSSRRRRLSERRALQRVAARRQLDAPPPEVDGFWALVRRLPDRQAAAVALFYLDDLSIAEIADALDCAEGTAKAHLHQARRTLAGHLLHPEHDR
jgi:RNA polymerase sigma-70 factor (ECF subfamily)